MVPRDKGCLTWCFIGLWQRWRKNLREEIPKCGLDVEWGLRSDNVQTTKCPSGGFLHKVFDFPMFFRIFFTETLDHMGNDQRDPEYSPSGGKVAKECYVTKVRFMTEPLGVFDIQHTTWFASFYYRQCPYLELRTVGYLLFLFFHRTNPVCWCSGNMLLKTADCFVLC